MKRSSHEHLILIIIVLYAARSLDNAVVVVGAVQSQLEINRAAMSYIHAVTEHVIKTVHIHSSSTLTAIDDCYLALATI